MATDVIERPLTVQAQTDEPAAEQRYIICMKWGDKYSAEYVNRLYNMVSRHLTLDFQMVCLTDDNVGIDPAIQCYPIPELNLPPGLPERGWKKLTTFAPELYNLKGVALFLDIDIVIVDNIDEFFTYQAEHEDSVVIIRDWKKPWRMIGNSSVYRFNVGMHIYPDLLANFERNFDTIRQQVRHEQAYLSNYLREHHHLEYWDKRWCVSFKYQCIAPIPFNIIKAPKLPNNAKIVIFHGEINPPDAIAGTGGKWYRHIKPSPWLTPYWQ
ncbi:glycosyltransferase [Psychrobacter frigidicola]|uniref:Glycosyltransferase n=2 Tax=Psychrobacter frigidicola TaxID=45611 RepID=A0A5C7AAM7_9GAMM|nr:glycosyltransferase [Psychrobacter frigidicola]TXD97903.1 glycosyltransferase [Psychrobacter frigidicola]